MKKNERFLIDAIFREFFAEELSAVGTGKRLLFTSSDHDARGHCDGHRSAYGNPDPGAPRTM